MGTACHNHDDYQRDRSRTTNYRHYLVDCIKLDGIVMFKKCASMWPDALFFSGPFFLGAAVFALVTGLQWVQWLTFKGLGIILLIGTPLVCVLPEVFWGTYKTAEHVEKE